MYVCKVFSVPFVGFDTSSFSLPKFVVLPNSEPGPGEDVFAPRFVEKLQPKHVPDGATVQFECQVEGNPRPQITWFRQTAIIKPSQDFQVTLKQE